MHGITALQMDIKITGVSADLLRQALAQAREARLAILESMAKAISEPRTELSPYAPQVVTVKIDSDQIGLIIGKGGETIRGLEEEFDCKIDIEEDGFVRIYASSAAMGEGCRQRIEEMTRPIGVGTVYRDRKVVKTAEFGAFIELRKGTDGLLHASRISPGVRVDSVDQVLTRGDVVTVEVTEVDTERGRVGLKLVSKRRTAPRSRPRRSARATRSSSRTRARAAVSARRATAIAPAAASAAAIAPAGTAAAAVSAPSDLRNVRAAGLAVSLAGDESAPPLVLAARPRGAAPGVRLARPAARAAPAAGRDRPAGVRRLAAAARRRLRPRRRLRAGRGGDHRPRPGAARAARALARRRRVGPLRRGAARRAPRARAGRARQG